MTTITPIDDHPVRIEYFVSAADADAWIKREHLNTAGTVLGLDCEWRPTFFKGQTSAIALLQLATQTSCALIHLTHLAPGPFLRKVLDNPEVLKVGVGIAHDVELLLQTRKLRVRGLIDVGELAAAKDSSLSGHSLKRLGLALLGIESWKRKKVTMSNWEKRPLTPKQIEYAALDAWVSQALFHHFRLSPEEARYFMHGENWHAPSMARMADSARPAAAAKHKPQRSGGKAVPAAPISPATSTRTVRATPPSGEPGLRRGVGRQRSRTRSRSFNSGASSPAALTWEEDTLAATPAANGRKPAPSAAPSHDDEAVRSLVHQHARSRRRINKKRKWAGAAKSGPQQTNQRPAQ